ncbi:tetratricopeptide-like helical [Fusarium mundagurra]|uniref:Tetratricopeptide-like helical n=1 Tax=Fusarium mundagurra TaxID=1567541 RepID=A0A8H5Y024_9HYPO|nr:tetratricopeptide-like helical [Fusarium mundagurra]
MEVVGVIAGVPGLIQIIQAVTTAISGVSKKDLAPKIAQNLVHSLQNVAQILERGKEQGLWDERQFEQHKSTIEQWTKELASLNDMLQPSNLKKEPRRSLKKFCLILTELERRLNEWSTRLSQIQTELILIMTDVQQHAMRRILHETVTARLRSDLHPCSTSFIPDKTPGTCEWIWSQLTFCDWTKASSIMPDSYIERLLCIYGMKGCGKSVLIKSIAQRLGEQGQIALHFSFWSGNENQRKLQDLLRTLVWQTLGRITDVDLEKVSKLLTGSDGIDKRSLVEAFSLALSGIDQKVYCTIDGIDESAEDWNSDTDGCLSTILDLVKNHTNFYVLLSGREASMRTLLKKALPRLEITEHLIRSDIEKLIAVEIHDSLRNYSPVTRAEAQKELEARTQIMFLWVTLVLKELRRCCSIEDVRHTLQHAPHDLDREYHRLFFQLMTRTRGSRAKPSISMKRARYVLSSILACPEPMTGEDLCYAYATQVNTSGTVGDDLITIEGIIDACGDFVRVTEGRYHIIHASASDFLMRPKNQWELEDMDISYFRIDLTEVQESMSLACFKYLKSIDIGYPLTDGKALSLPSKHKFFSYAARYLPFHLTHALQGSKKAKLEMTEFVRTHQFCALMEYILATSQDSLQNDILDTCYYWAQTFYAGVEQMELDLAFHLELTRREKDFGTKDERYQSWLAMAFLFPTNSHQLFERQATPSTRLRRNSAPSVVFPNIFDHQGYGFRSPSFISGVSAGSYTSPCNERCKAAGEVATLREASGCLGVRYYVNDDTSETIEQMVRESVRIATCLPTQLHVQWLKLQSVQMLVLMLLGQKRTEDAGEFIRMYEDLIRRDRKRCAIGAWEYGLSHTQMGTLYRTRTLDQAARSLYDDGEFTVSASFAAQAIAIFEDSRTKPTAEHLSFFLTHRDALYDAGEFDECISSCQRILSFTRRLESEPVVTDVRWQTLILVARCRANQGNATEADKWFRKAANELRPPGPESSAPERPVLLMARELLENWEISQSEDEEDLHFGPLEPLVTKLKGIGSIEPNSKEFLRCYSLLMLGKGIMDVAEKAEYWERGLMQDYDDIEIFSKRRSLLKLKYIETWLRQDDGLYDALEGYRNLARFFFKQGDTEAADLVSSDAELRIFSESSSDDDSWASQVVSRVYLYAGRFSECITLLSRAYQKSLPMNGNAVYNFETEMVYASAYINRLEKFEEDLEKAGLRLSFLEKSCEHLSKASRRMDEINRQKGTRPLEEQSDGEHDAGERRKERMTDLKARLEDLNGGSMLTEAMARLESVAPGAEVSSEGDS